MTGPVAAAGDGPPASLGKPVISVVPLGKLGGHYYVSNRHFPTVGQSIAVTKPIRLTEVVPHMSDRTTLLSAEGMRVFDTPGFEDTASPEVLDRIEVTQFKRNYKIPTTLTTSVYQHAGPIPPNFDINDGTYTLKAQRVEKRVISTGNPLVVKFPEKPLLEAGYYLVVFQFADLPRKVLTLFISGRQEGLKGQDQIYPYGRPYYSDAETPGIFQEGLMKYIRADGSGADWGKDTWCRGDIQMWVFGDPAPGPTMKPVRTSGNPQGPDPDRDRCWKPGSKP
jgi:hypothetical protein